jgi:hypothetical protein
VPTNYRRNVDRFCVACLQERDDLELLQYFFNFRRILRLQRTNHNVLASLATPAAFVEHLEGFANSSSVAEEDLESSTAIPPLFRLGLRKQLLWAMPLG